MHIFCVISRLDRLEKTIWLKCDSLAKRIISLKEATLQINKTSVKLLKIDFAGRERTNATCKLTDVMLSSLDLYLEAFETVSFTYYSF